MHTSNIKTTKKASMKRTAFRATIKFVHVGMSLANGSMSETQTGEWARFIGTCIPSTAKELTVLAYLLTAAVLLSVLGPEGRPGMSSYVSPCLESQGCALFPLSYLLSRLSA